MNIYVTIMPTKNINGKYFVLFKSNKIKEKRRKKLDIYLKQIDIDNYYILKSTNKFRFIEKEDFLKEFKYSGYMFYKKDFYSKEYIECWLDFLYNKIKITPPFLSKPFPPEYIKDMIKIIDKI